MGLFLSMSGVIGSEHSLVETALREYAVSHHGEMREESLTPEDDGCLIITEDVGGVTVLQPRDFFRSEELSSYLSKELRKPVFCLHLEDSDFWMYILFDGGSAVDQFNPVPDYWGDLDGDDVAKWQGNAHEVARRVPGLSAESVSKYLTRWGGKVFESAERTKAYPDDEFCYGDDWQLVDFMKRLGLTYPIDDHGAAFGTTYRFVCRADAE